MDLRRLRAGEWIGAVAGVVLIVSLFLPWYELQGSKLSAWETFALIDVLLFVAGAVGIGVLAIVASQRTAAVGIAIEALAFLICAPIALATLGRVLNLPGQLEGAGAGRAAFAWIGLLAAFGVAAGALVAMRDERISSPGRPTDPAGAPVDASPEVEVMPAPARGAAS